jgi:hypothetical protein
MTFRFPRFAILACAAALPGCAAPNPLMCPPAAVLADASYMVVMRPGAAADLSGEAYSVQMTDVTTECSLDRKRGETDSSLNLSFRAVRAPSADGASYSVPYFVAVTMTDRVVNKRLYTVRFSFAPGASTAIFNVSPDNTEIKLGNGRLPWHYQLTAGLQLTDAQIAYAKKMGRYAQ